MIEIQSTVTLVELTPIGLVADNGSVWVTMKPRWWDLAALFWWWLAPADRRAWVMLRLTGGEKLRCRAICVAKGHVRIAKVERVK
jgi:hypothetical protein